MDIEEVQSKTINFLRFPLIVGVVLMHSKLTNIAGSTITVEEFPLYHYLSLLLTDILFSIRVPLFFFISGILFFHNIKSFTRDTYSRKIKNRFHTIFLPYLFWSFIAMLLYLSIEIIFPNISLGSKKAILDYTPFDFIRSLWVVPSKLSTDIVYTVPMVFQFWFLRDLLVAMLLSPLVFYSIRYFKHYYLILLFALAFLNIIPNTPGFKVLSFFFFSFGAYFSINKTNVIQTFDRFYSFSGWVALALTICLLLSVGSEWYTPVYTLYSLICIAFIFSFTGKKIKAGRWKPIQFLTAAVFFIYASHGFITSFAVKILPNLLSLNKDWQLCLLFIGIPAFVVYICALSFHFSKKYFPRFTAFITGGRV